VGNAKFGRCFVCRAGIPGQCCLGITSLSTDLHAVLWPGIRPDRRSAWIGVVWSGSAKMGPGRIGISDRGCQTPNRIDGRGIIVANRAYRVEGKTANASGAHSWGHPLAANLPQLAASDNG